METEDINASNQNNNIHNSSGSMSRTEFTLKGNSIKKASSINSNEINRSAHQKVLASQRATRDASARPK